MENKSDNKAIWIFGAALLIIVLIIFIPGLVKDMKSLETSKQEYNLVGEGKSIPVSDIVEDFAKLISQKDYVEASKYLSEDKTLLDSNNIERVKLEYCFEKLSPHTSHNIEKRGNDLKNEETYRIFWNGTKYENTKQIITLNLRKKVKSNEVTYEIFKVIFTDNTLTF